MENQLNAAYYASSAVMNPSASKPINYQEDESTSGPKKKKKKRGVEEGPGSLLSPQPRNGMKTRFLGISPLFTGSVRILQCWMSCGCAGRVL